MELIKRPLVHRVDLQVVNFLDYGFVQASLVEEVVDVLFVDLQLVRVKVFRTSHLCQVSVLNIEYLLGLIAEFFRATKVALALVSSAELLSHAEEHLVDGGVLELPKLELLVICLKALSLLVFLSLESLLAEARVPALGRVSLIKESCLVLVLLLFGILVEEVVVIHWDVLLLLHQEVAFPG